MQEPFSPKYGICIVSTLMFLKILGLYLYTLIIGHKSCNL